MNLEMNNEKWHICYFKSCLYYQTNVLFFIKFKLRGKTYGFQAIKVMAERRAAPPSMRD